MSNFIEVDAQANGQIITLAQGQGVVIRLPENPTTGYRWTVASCEGMRLEADDYFPSGGGVGAAGTRRFRWRPVGSGAFQIGLVLRRAWEDPAATAGRFVLKILCS
ncbi:MAG: hypothetical protein FIA97_19810 [Methylococcaceae bacterium]|nr:hypothetical protein [Methylococcaceae bacterium]